MRIALAVLAGVWLSLVATVQSGEAPLFQIERKSTARGSADRKAVIEQGDSWAFRPPRDSFSAAALWNLSQLNEKVAGEHGFIGLSPDGDSFVRGDGQPIRFWGGTTYVQ